MPELPEVETIRRDLERKILHKRIFKVEVKDKRSLKGFSVKKFKKELERNSFVKIDRRGKLLIFKIQSKSPLERGRGVSKFLLVHLKMTGQLIYQNLEVRNENLEGEIVAGGHSDSKVDFDLPNKSTKVVFEFKDSSKLYFNDQRIFGYLKIVKEKDLKDVYKKFGVEPLTTELTIEFIQSLVKNKKTTIKSFLLDQKNIAGIGNIYADEICFACQILPERRVNELSENDFKNIVKQTKRILKLAIDKRGTTFNNYRDSDGNKGNFVKYLKVFGRQGEPCLVCKNEICKIKLNGRGTHFCKFCQK